MAEANSRLTARVFPQHEPFRAELLIDGRSVAARSRAVFQRTNPITGEVVTIAAAASAEDVDDAGCAAAAAFSEWSVTPAETRAAILRRAKTRLQERADEIAHIMSLETGGTLDWCHFNVELAGRIMEQAALLAGEVSPPRLPEDMSPTGSFVVRQPAGVCLAIAPWNAPIVLGVRSFAFAIAWGNTVILKTSELCPATQRVLGDIMSEAGLPPGVLNILSHAPEAARDIVEALIAHPVVRRINFTGSTRVGRIIAEISARHMKRCLMELSGKAPLVVLADADLDAAADAAVFGAFFNQGQICMSTERIIVEEAVADALLERMIDRARALKAGDPAFAPQPLGAVISESAGRRLAGLVDDATRKGAHVCLGGKVLGTLMDATIIDGITRDMRLYREEIFGPVAAVIRVADADEAVTIANDCDYGLSGAVFSENLPRAFDVAMRIETGIMHINGATVTDDPAMPFGGVKASGYGRIGGLSALDEFTEQRWVTMAQTKQQYRI
ncbi:aldehyde dehydrogenase family protein [Rhizobium sp. SL86]|uniref:aldehyde dehydrogenase family protein n=1 Tax=Rhizobium sp. SL86 TaxID=2995148 RepID=UPI00227264FF|nr:aldehyde dehydrogenase family protein [Rhizobium sp. SL86]MCY1666946.1 aldehyde dehydrogenase family protein [Rhizobium sp. SL86]